MVRRILTFGKGHHLPKDMASIQGGIIAPVAFYNEVSRLRTQRQATLEKQSKKRSLSALLPPAKGQRTIASMFQPTNATSDARSSSNSTMPTKASSSSNSAFNSEPKRAPKPKAKPKPMAPKREFTEQVCEKENKKTKEQILEYLLAVSGKMAHPLHPSKEGVQWSCQRVESTSLRTQIEQMGADAVNNGGVLVEIWSPGPYRSGVDVSFLFFG